MTMKIFIATFSNIVAANEHTATISYDYYIITFPHTVFTEKYYHRVEKLKRLKTWFYAFLDQINKFLAFLDHVVMGVWYAVTAVAATVRKKFVNTTKTKREPRLL